jgi:hypothetical protein
MDPIQNMQKKDGKKDKPESKVNKCLGGQSCNSCACFVFFFYAGGTCFFCGKHNLQTKIPHAKKGTKKQYNHPTSQYTITIPKQKQIGKNLKEHISDPSPVGFS